MEISGSVQLPLGFLYYESVTRPCLFEHGFNPQSSHFATIGHGMNCAFFRVDTEKKGAGHRTPSRNSVYKVGANGDPGGLVLNAYRLAGGDPDGR
jgi:hypothetical protein